MIFLQGGGKI